MFKSEGYSKHLLTILGLLLLFVSYLSKRWLLLKLEGIRDFIWRTPKDVDLAASIKTEQIFKSAPSAEEIDGCRSLKRTTLTLRR